MINPHQLTFLMRREGSDHVLTTSAISLVSKGSDLAETEARLRTFLVEIATLSEQRGFKLLTSSDLGSEKKAAEDRKKAAGTDQSAALSKTIGRVMLVALIVAITVAPALVAAHKISGAWAEFKRGMADPARIVSLLSGSVNRFAELIEKITPERRDQVTRDLSRIAIGLAPFAAEVKPLWLGSSRDRNAAKSPVPQEGGP